MRLAGFAGGLVWGDGRFGGGTSDTETGCSSRGVAGVVPLVVSVVVAAGVRSSGGVGVYALSPSQERGGSACEEVFLRALCRERGLPWVRYGPAEEAVPLGGVRRR